METRSIATVAASGFVRAGLLLALVAGVSGCADRDARAASYMDVRIEADAPTAGECREAVAIRFEPVDVPADPRSALYQRETYSDEPTITGKPVEDGPRNFECWFDYRSRDLAPGRWRVIGEFTGGVQSCVRDVLAGRVTRVRMDAEDGCVDYAS